MGRAKRAQRTGVRPRRGDNRWTERSGGDGKPKQKSLEWKTTGERRACSKWRRRCVRIEAKKG